MNKILSLVVTAIVRELIKTVLRDRGRRG